MAEPTEGDVGGGRDREPVGNACAVEPALRDYGPDKTNTVPPSARQRTTTIEVKVHVNVARVVLAIGAVIAMIIAAKNGISLPPL